MTRWLQYHGFGWGVIKFILGKLEPKMGQIQDLLTFFIACFAGGCPVTLSLSELDLANLSKYALSFAGDDGSGDGISFCTYWWCMRKRAADNGGKDARRSQGHCAANIYNNLGKTWEKLGVLDARLLMVLIDRKTHLSSSTIRKTHLSYHQPIKEADPGMVLRMHGTIVPGLKRSVMGSKKPKIKVVLQMKHILLYAALDQYFSVSGDCAKQFDSVMDNALIDDRGYMWTSVRLFPSCGLNTGVKSIKLVKGVVVSNVVPLITRPKIALASL
ncbi:hypothetical protein MKW98_027010 [Papaver atlanticum]|uniref:Uncharacterized protein n=1 Tax=Papaver atlanticum TaxID=357466 RepID=A0AAD4RXD5_9MAGN|nr:hypothetical protein MKW98_027010 [Papaver atlanticum]